jgi:hypothetical protein
MSCYICLSSKTPLLQPDCVCKTLRVHRSCFKKWLDTAPDLFACAVCKTDMSPAFVSRFATMEQIMAYDPDGELEEDDDEEDEHWFMEYSVPTYLDDDGNYYFHTMEHMSVFVESRKKEIASQKQCYKRQSTYVLPSRHIPKVRNRVFHYRR